jgi:geranylgeranyl diphosphate synthase type II
MSHSNIKLVPKDAPTRAAIRRAASEAVDGRAVRAKLNRDELEALAGKILQDAGLPAGYLGFAMVALSNAHWRESFAAVPFGRRLLLLPHCLRDELACPAQYDSVGLRCSACGACNIDDLKRRAEEAGYTVVVAEGTTSVLMKILEGEADAILGVACLDSLEKSYQRIAELGVPHVAAPLLSNGCKQTKAEISEILGFLSAKGGEEGRHQASHIPLLRLSGRLLAPEALRESLKSAKPADPTDRIALDWLAAGGKRLRPFVTMASYAAAAHGRSEFGTEEEAEKAIPAAVRNVALAIEALHKASLAHDDIEDNDPFRYGEQTLHKRYGVGPALNVGDYLVGLGYRLVAEQAEALGADVVADLVACAKSLTPAQALETYALKTSPAFYAAVYCGLRAARVDIDEAALHEFCTYLGEGYQIQNDLDDWEQDGTNKVEVGADAQACRPTILRAFAGDASGSDMKRVYEETRAFEKAEALLARVRERALSAAAAINPLPVGEFLASLVRMVLPQRTP